MHGAKSRKAAIEANLWKHSQFDQTVWKRGIFPVSRDRAFADTNASRARATDAAIRSLNYMKVPYKAMHRQNNISHLHLSCFEVLWSTPSTKDFEDLKYSCLYFEVLCKYFEVLWSTSTKFRIVVHYMYLRYVYLYYLVRVLKSTCASISQHLHMQRRY